MAPRFEIDPFWPKSPPNGWLIGSAVGVSVDSSEGAARRRDVANRWVLPYSHRTVPRIHAMGATTTIKLPPELKARVAALASRSGRSTHSFIIEAVERHAAHEEKMQDFVKEALQADADIERTGEVYKAEDVHAWLERLVKGGKATRPKPWRR